MEIWKTFIQGYYEVSDLGGIRSVDRIIDFNGTLGLRKGIELKQTINSKGYLTVVICVDGTRKTMYSHRVVALTFIDNPEDKPEVNHKDGNTLNNAKANLEWNTSEENKEHAKLNGLVSSCGAKLVANEVAEIKYLIANGLSNPAIAKEYGVDKATIRNIRIGKSWTHIKAVESLT